MERANFEKWKPKEVARLLALVETERRYYQEIVASIPVSILIVGPQLAAVSANRQLRVKLGKRNEEILGHSLTDLLKIDGIEAAAEQVVASGAAGPRQDLFWNGQPVRVTVLPLRNWEEDSDAEALIVIEDQAATAPALTAGQEKALEVADQIDGMLWESDYDAGNITHASAGASTLFGYSAEQWLSDKSLWAQRVHEPDRQRVDDFYHQLGRGAAPVCSIEYEAIHATGKKFWARDTVRVTRDEQGRPIRVAGLSTNVSQRRELEQSRTLAVKGEALQRLSAKLAHDLNNLLMIVAGYGEELKNALPTEHPLHQDMKQILGATERLYSMTTQFQTYTRRPVINPKPIAIVDLLSHARPKIEQALGPLLRLELNVSPTSANAKLDSAQIEDALISLAKHSAFVSKDAGVLSIGAEQVFRSEALGSGYGLQTGSYLRLTIEHSVEAPAGEVLEPWLQADEQTREIELGVATAYQIIRQSQGDLIVDGRAVHVFLPLLAEPDQASQPAVAHTETAGPPSVTQGTETTLETILVVEDEGGIRALVRKILRRQGYNVFEASHGEEALALLAQPGNKVDLLLTDVMMPGMNGVELSQRALAGHASLKVLFVSGYTDESVLESGQFPAGTAFLQKPFTLGSLLGKVREVLDGGIARRAAS